MIEYVAGFYFEENLVFLVLKNKPDWQKNLWNGIGGKIENGETPAAAMRREFREETGLDIQEWEKFAVLRDERDWNVHFFRSFSMVRAGAMPKQNDRGEALQWHTVDSPPSCCIPNLYWLVPFAFYQRVTEPIVVMEP